MRRHLTPDAPDDSSIRTIENRQRVPIAMSQTQPLP